MENLELSVKYNLSWDRLYGYEHISSCVTFNGDTVLNAGDWLMAKTVAGLLNTAYNMGKMAGLLEAQNYKDVRKDIDAIVAALND